MRRSTATRLLVVVVAAAVLLILPLLDSCAAVSAHRLPRRAPVLLLGGSDTGAWERGGRSPAQGRTREGRELQLAVGVARRLGLRTSVEKPPSPKPHGMTGMAMPVPPPPPSANE